MFYKLGKFTVINTTQIVSINRETNLDKESKLIISMSNGERYRLSVGKEAEKDFKEFMQNNLGLTLDK